MPARARRGDSDGYSARVLLLMWLAVLVCVGGLVALAIQLATLDSSNERSRHCESPSDSRTCFR